MKYLIVTGTGTDVGKTVATAALAAAYGAQQSVGICKPVQTGLPPGVPGDAAEAARAAGIADYCEFYRYPEPLAPETAARRAGMEPPDRERLCAQIVDAANTSGVELMIVEGAGGLLVRLGPELTILDIARDLHVAGHGVEVVVVARAGLGTLSDTELTVDRIRCADLRVRGVIIGSFPAEPDLATQCNLADLPRLSGAPVLGCLPAGVGTWPPERFIAGARQWLGVATDNPPEARVNFQ